MRATMTSVGNSQTTAGSASAPDRWGPALRAVGIGLGLHGDPHVAGAPHRHRLRRLPALDRREDPAGSVSAPGGRAPAPAGRGLAPGAGGRLRLGCLLPAAVRPAGRPARHRLRARATWLAQPGSRPARRYALRRHPDRACADVGRTQLRRLPCRPGRHGRCHPGRAGLRSVPGRTDRGRGAGVPRLHALDAGAKRLAGAWLRRLHQPSCSPATASFWRRPPGRCSSTSSPPQFCSGC